LVEGTSNQGDDIEKESGDLVCQEGFETYHFNQYLHVDGYGLDFLTSIPDTIEPFSTSTLFPRVELVGKSNLIAAQNQDFFRAKTDNDKSEHDGHDGHDGRNVEENAQNLPNSSKSFPNSSKLFSETEDKTFSSAASTPTASPTPSPPRLIFDCIEHISTLTQPGQYRPVPYFADSTSGPVVPYGVGIPMANAKQLTKANINTLVAKYTNSELFLTKPTKAELDEQLQLNLNTKYDFLKRITGINIHGFTYAQLTDINTQSKIETRINRSKKCFRDRLCTKSSQDTFKTTIGIWVKFKCNELDLGTRGDISKALLTPLDFFSDSIAPMPTKLSTRSSVVNGADGIDGFDGGYYYGDSLHHGNINNDHHHHHHHHRHHRHNYNEHNPHSDPPLKNLNLINPTNQFICCITGAHKNQHAQLIFTKNLAYLFLKSYQYFYSNFLTKPDPALLKYRSPNCPSPKAAPNVDTRWYYSALTVSTDDINHLNSLVGIVNQTVEVEGNENNSNNNSDNLKQDSIGSDNSPKKKKINFRKKVKNAFPMRHSIFISTPLSQFLAVKYSQVQSAIENGFILEKGGELGFLLDWGEGSENKNTKKNKKNKKDGQNNQTATSSLTPHEHNYKIGNQSSNIKRLRPQNTSHDHGLHQNNPNFNNNNNNNNFHPHFQPNHYPQHFLQNHPQQFQPIIPQHFQQINPQINNLSQQHGYHPQHYHNDNNGEVVDRGDDQIFIKRTVPMNNYHFNGRNKPQSK